MPPRATWGWTRVSQEAKEEEGRAWPRAFIGVLTGRDRQGRLGTLSKLRIG